MIKTSTFVFLILVFTAIALADDSCKLSRPPKLIKRASADPHEHFRIRFKLEYFDEFCLLKVRIPRGTLVTFNLTSWVNWSLSGDKLVNQIQLRTEKKIHDIACYLDIINVDDEFGTRLGRFVLNQQEVHEVTYHVAPADDSCKFSKLPRLIKRMSADPHEDFSIRFRMKYFNDFCLLKVRIPRGTLVTFNLTNWSNRMYGDKLANQMQLTTHEKIHSIGCVLDIVNLDNDFGTRFGRYMLNQQEVYGVPYKESVVGPVMDIHFSNCSQDTFAIRGTVKTTSSFQQCLQYNKDKGKNEGEYLFCRKCNKIPTFNRDNSMIGFEMENVDESEQLITCQIKTDHDGVNYILRLDLSLYSAFCTGCVYPVPSSSPRRCRSGWVWSEFRKRCVRSRRRG